MKTLSGTRLEIYRAGDSIMLWTNGRTLVLDLEQAEQITIGIAAILSGEHDEAITFDTLEQIRHTAPEPTPVASSRKPTLDQI